MYKVVCHSTYCLRCLQLHEREKLADAWDFLEVQVNPYRQPVSCKTSDNALPSYANGFIFGMIPRKPKPPKVINLDSDSE